MTPAISIIVPVYNASKYLRKCIDSILAQTFSDFELILVDDGSTDDSGKICDSYTSDERVHVLHRTNSGVSASRNAGIEAAKGKYLQFVDSDDWITPDAANLLINRAENTKSDLVIADFYRVVGERVSRKGDIDSDEPMSVTEFAETMMENPADFYYGVLWNKLFRHDIITEHHLRMDPTISWCEDFLFNLEYIRYCHTITALRTPIYYYVKRKGSLVTQGNSISRTIQMKNDVFTYYQQFYKNVFSDEEYLKYRSQIYRFWFDAAGDGFAAPSIMPNSYKLGEERVSLDPVLASGEGVLADLYRKKRQFEQRLETAALKNQLTLTEAEILYCLWKTSDIHSYKELQLLTGIGRASLYAGVQHLVILKYISAEDVRSDDSLTADEHWTLLHASRNILADIRSAEEAYLETEKGK